MEKNDTKTKSTFLKCLIVRIEVSVLNCIDLLIVASSQLHKNESTCKPFFDTLVQF